MHRHDIILTAPLIDIEVIYSSVASPSRICQSTHSLYADPELADLISLSKVLWGEMDGRVNGKTGYQKRGRRFMPHLCGEE